jgi:hypothetical protein
MSIFIQEVLGLLKRNQKKITLDKTKDWFEFGKLYQSSVLNTGASYNPKMDPFVIKWGDLVCQATEDLTRTLPGEGNLGFVPVYTDPSGYCSWDTLKDSIITQNALNTIINIAGNLVVAGDAAINGCDLTSTCNSFNLLNQPATITFGSGATNIFIGRADPTSTVTIVGTQDSNACTNGALVVNGGVGIAKNLFVCANANIAGDVAINGGDLTSTASTFNLLGQSTNINFGASSQNILIGSANSTSDVTILSTQESTSCTTGALVINGGVGIAKNLNLCGILSINNTTQSTDCTTGALVVAGGVGIAKDLFVCGNATITGDAAINGGDLTSTASNFNLLQQSTTIGFGYTSQVINMGGISAVSTVVINGSQDSTSCSTGALRVIGGVGIAKNLFVCGDINVSSNSFFNGDVYLGDALGDQIYLNGTLLDNNGNASLVNQALVGIGTGAATWQNVALVGEVCAVNSIPLWTPNSSTLGCSLIYQNGNNATPATKIFLKGGLASENSQVRTITDIALGDTNYAGGDSSAALCWRTLALGGDSFAIGHRGIAGGHGSLAAGYNTGAGNYGFGFFNTTTTSTTLVIEIVSGTIAVGNFIYANVGTDPSIRYEVLTLVGTGGIGLNTITIATPISVSANEAVAIEEAVPDRGDSQGAIALGVNTASKGQGAVAIGTRAATDIPNQIAIGSSFTTVKLDGTVNDNVPNKLLVIDSGNIVRWRDASTITATITANNGLTMSTASNVQLGGTLIQNTDIPTGDYRIRLSSSTTKINPVFMIDALGTASNAHGIFINSAGGYAGYFEANSGLGALFATNAGTTPAVTFQQINGQVVGKFTRTGANNTGIGNILDLYNTCATGPAVVGLGTAINFNIEDNLSTPSNAGTISFDWTSFASGNSSRFVVKTVGFGISSNQLEVSNEGLLTLNSYGLGAFYDPSNIVNYTLAAKASGEIVEIPYQASPKVFAALISQSGTGTLDFPTMQVLWDYSAGGVTFTWSRVSAGLYELTASQPEFLGPKTAFYIIPDVNSGKPYCAAIERVSDTVLRVNSFDMTGASDDNCFFRATLKIEIYP